MKYRKFGSTGWDVSEIGFGAWAIGGGWGAQDDPDSLKALHRAIDLGVNFIDTAQGYGNGHSERLIGKVLKERSEAIYVATKIGPEGNGPWPPSPYCDASVRYSEKYLRRSVEERIQNLGTEAIDILQLHSWTRAWNDNPLPLQILAELKKEGKVRAIGISTPEQDQNCAVQLMRDGVIDSLQVIYNIFEQEPAAQILPVAAETSTAVIVRVAFDEGVLTGKYTAGHQFPEGDFRRNYFASDRMARAAARVEKLKADLEGSDRTLPETALSFVLAHPSVSTVIPGIRNIQPAEANTSVSDLPPLDENTLSKLRTHNWRRGIWYQGK